MTGIGVLFERHISMCRGVNICPGESLCCTGAGLCALSDESVHKSWRTIPERIGHIHILFHGRWFRIFLRRITGLRTEIIVEEETVKIFLFLIIQHIEIEKNAMHCHTLSEKLLFFGMKVWLYFRACILLKSWTMAIQVKLLKKCF